VVQAVRRSLQILASPPGVAVSQSGQVNMMCETECETRPEEWVADGRRRPWLLLLLLMLTLSGCATEPRWPAITDSSGGPSMPGRWVWTELITADVETAKSFYGALFSWRFETIGDGDKHYTLIHNGDAPIGGILFSASTAQSSSTSRWIGLVSVADADAAAKQAAAGNGTVLLPPRRLEGRGDVALLADPEGARFAVIRSDVGDPPDQFPAVGDFIWRELWAAEAAGMARFYASLTGATAENVTTSAHDVEWHLRAAGYPRAGIVQESVDGLPSAWLQYVRVKDVNEAVSRAERLGAVVLLEPTADVRAGSVAIVLDPLGGAIGLAEWRDDTDGGGEQ
jgi:predicted enzyme related to lactoylglutathione lyase